MSDYYQILGLPENASDEDIRKAFRKLAFQYHPDKNPGHEKEVEKKFKDISEAYGVLSDKAKRQHYDLRRSSPQGFQYSQQDIFRDTFNNQATMEDLNRMFAQAGLRFDRDFLNRVFFESNNMTFRFYYAGYGSGSYSHNESPARGTTRPASRTYKPNFLERTLTKIMLKFTGFALKQALGVQYSPPKPDLDQHQELELSGAEATAGGEKEIVCRGDKKPRRLLVKIPAGIQEGTQIRLKGQGKKQGKSTGDMYLIVKVKTPPRT